MNKHRTGILLVLVAAGLCPRGLAQTGGADPPSCEAISGWAYGLDHSTVTVDLFTKIGDQAETYVASAVANQYRPDRPSYHGFRILLPNWVKDGLLRLFIVRSGGVQLFAVGAECYASGNYQYYLLNNFDPTKWVQNGSISLGGTGLTATSASGGSWISNVPAPDGSSDYEVRMTVHLTASGGTYAAYLRASPDAMSGPSAQGTYYSVELQNPSVTANACTATLAMNMRSGGAITLLASAVIPCHRETTIRAVRSAQSVIVWVDGIAYLWVDNTAIPAGMPGVGVWGQTGNSITRVDLGPIDRTPPSPLNAKSIATSALPNRIDFQWAGAADNPGGIGTAFYNVYRNGEFLVNISGTDLTDWTVSPHTTYMYTVHVADYHGNFEWSGSSATFSVTTPPAGSIDPARAGVRPTGAYWGAAGEQIDTRSGNLNFTLPLLKAEGRGGGGVPFALSYNSQMWRREGRINWKLGRDVGYGVGWRLQAGSITPYLFDPAVHHYVFTDSTGAEYRLDVNNNGIWTSREGIYVEYEPATYRLYFPDGTFWVMGAVSAGTEQDAGTRYPTLMQSTNGNQVIVRYYPGLGVDWPDSSARIAQIEDVRSRVLASYYSGRRTYTFTYNDDAVPHLIRIDNHISTIENYDFSYAYENLYSPLGLTAFEGTGVLTQVSVRGLGIGHTMEYNQVSGGGVVQPATSGELTRVVLPQGGALRWDYRAFTYSGDRTLREVQNRYLTKAAGATEQGWGFYHDDAASSPIHQWTVLADPSGSGKTWFFYTDQWYAGLLSVFEDRSSPWTGVLRDRGYGWAQDATGNAYLSQVAIYQDPETSYEKVSFTTQILDTHGNVIRQDIYDYPNQTTPARTYLYTYLTNANYTSRHIWNRLVSATANGTTLVTNTYDGSTLTDRTELSEHDLDYGTGFTYRGNLTRSVTPGAVKNIAYDITGAAVSANDGYGHTVSSTLSSGTNYAAPDAITPNSNENLASAYTYTSFLGLASVTAPNGAYSRIQYDSYGRPISSKSPHGAVTTYAYTYNPSTVTTATTDPTSYTPIIVTAPGSRFSKSTLDGLGRTVRVEIGDNTGVKSIVDTEYEACACSPLGKVKRVSRPYAPGQTPVWTTYTYDALGRTLTITVADGSVTSYAYQGNTTTVTDPAGKWKKYTMDAMGNLIQVTEPAPEGGTHETYYAYNVFNQLTNVTMPRGGVTQTRTFNYNLATGRLDSATNPENGTVTYSYNGDGTLAYKIDAKNQRTDYTYDSYGRLKQAAGVKYYYDTDPFGTDYMNGWGRLTGVEYQGGTLPGGSIFHLTFRETYYYTTGGLMSGKKFQINNITFHVESAYNYEGQYLGPCRYPGNYSPSYNYTLDALARPVKFTRGRLNPDEEPLDLVWGGVYGAGGELTQMHMRNNGDWDELVENHTYNTLGQLTRLTVPGKMDQEYRYAAGQNNGRIRQMKDWISGEEVSYAYDSLNRLMQAETSGPEYGLSFSYDGFGNMTSQHAFKGLAFDTQLGYDGLTNRITSAGYGYDANGNLTAMPAMPGITMTYDAQNRMTQGGIIVYDAAGRRVWRRESDAWKGLVDFYGPDGKLLSNCWVQFDSYGLKKGGCDTEHVYFRGRYVRSQVAPYLAEDGRISASETALAVVGDRLGSTGKYFPYGYLRSGFKTQYATYSRDNTGLDYAVQRYYSSVIGRFTTPDPYLSSAGPADPQSWNRYAYVQNDPVNFYDPLGLAVFPAFDAGDTGFSGRSTSDEARYVMGGGGGSIAAFLAFRSEGFSFSNPYPVGEQSGIGISDASGASPMNWQLMPAAAARALQALTLNQECFNLFGTEKTRDEKWNPITVLTSLIISRDNTYGSVNFDYTGNGAALTTPNGFPIPSLSAGITGTSATISIKASWWNVNNVAYNAETLLHELGHVFNFVRGSGGFALPNRAELKDSQAFDKLIEDKCNIHF
jgi:RHS repeat-associated protein